MRGGELRKKAHPRAGKLPDWLPSHEPFTASRANNSSAGSAVPLPSSPPPIPAATAAVVTFSSHVKPPAATSTTLAVLPLGARWRMRQTGGSPEYGALPHASDGGVPPA